MTSPYPLDAVSTAHVLTIGTRLAPTDCGAAKRDHDARIEGLRAR